LLPNVSPLFFPLSFLSSPGRPWRVFCIYEVDFAAQLQSVPISTATHPHLSSFYPDV